MNRFTVTYFKMILMVEISDSTYLLSLSLAVETNKNTGTVAGLGDGDSW